MPPAGEKRCHAYRCGEQWHFVAQFRDSLCPSFAGKGGIVVQHCMEAAPDVY
jgi:hypothetical protein